jgi:hypothetical protein
MPGLRGVIGVPSAFSRAHRLNYKMGVTTYCYARIAYSRREM